MKPSEHDDAGSGQNFEIVEESLLQTKLFRVDRIRQTLPTGQSVVRDVIRHPGAVVILPILADGRVCLIRNYRVAVGKWLLELPAGTREPNEPALITAERELTEETGYRAGNIKPLCEFYMSPGILHERMHAFVATDLVEGETAREPGEMIDNELLTWQQIDEQLKQQGFEDAKTIATLLFYLRYGVD